MAFPIENLNEQLTEMLKKDIRSYEGPPCLSVNENVITVDNPNQIINKEQRLNIIRGLHKFLSRFESENGEMEVEFNLNSETVKILLDTLCCDQA